MAPQDKEIESPQAIISVRNVKKKYGQKMVHDGINLDIRRGEVMTLMGGSGSGKSVLLRSFVGLDTPDSGEIIFDGKNIATLSEDKFVEVRKKIAYVFQYGALFDSYTVAENLAYPLREHTKLSEEEVQTKVSATLKMVGLDGTEQLMPSDLSGGMARRVGVARSIIMEPEIILYDEPTTGLDPYNTKQILKIILQLKKRGVTSVLVTHDMSSIFQVTDRVAFLKDGIIRALGTVDEIRESKDPVVSSFIHGETM